MLGDERQQPAVPSAQGTTRPSRALPDPDPELDLDLALKGPERAEAPRRRWRPSLRQVIGGVLALMLGVFLYYWLGMELTYRMDNNPDWVNPAPVEGGSHAINMAAGLIRREVDVHGWVPNDPPISHTWFLENMPNFQRGIVLTIQSFLNDYNQFIAQARPGSRPDPNMTEAWQALSYSPNQWSWDWQGWTQMPRFVGLTSEDQYLTGARLLDSYNRKLAAGQVPIELRQDNLLAMLVRVDNVLGGITDEIENQIRTQPWGLFDPGDDDVFYTNKGRIYAYYMLLNALLKDFEPVIAGNPPLRAPWQQMLENLRLVAELKPLVVINAPPGDLLLPNHLAAQGFFVLRARARLGELIRILNPR